MHDIAKSENNERVVPVHLHKSRNVGVLDFDVYAYERNVKQVLIESLIWQQHFLSIVQTIKYFPICLKSLMS